MKNGKAKNILTEALLQFRTELKNNDYHSVYFSRSQAGQEGSVLGDTGSDGGQGSGRGDSMSEEGESWSEGSEGGDSGSEGQTSPGGGPFCDKEGWFWCEGAFDVDECDQRHTINPFSSAEERKYFSTWNLDHR